MFGKDEKKLSIKLIYNEQIHMKLGIRKVVHI